MATNYIEGQQLSYTQAKGTPYEKEPFTVEYVRPYEYREDDHVVVYPSGDKVAVRAADLTFGYEE